MPKDRGKDPRSYDPTASAQGSKDRGQRPWDQPSTYTPPPWPEYIAKTPIYGPGQGSKDRGNKPGPQASSYQGPDDEATLPWMTYKPSTVPWVDYTPPTVPYLEYEPPEPPITAPEDDGSKKAEGSPHDTGAEESTEDKEGTGTIVWSPSGPRFRGEYRPGGVPLPGEVEAWWQKILESMNTNWGYADLPGTGSGGSYGSGYGSGGRRGYGGGYNSRPAARWVSLLGEVNLRIPHG